MRATVHAEWDHTSAPAPFADCERTVRSSGIRDVRFRTTRPTTIRVAGARVLPADVRNLAGTVTLGGSHNVTERCGPTTREEIQDCVRSRRSFRGAVVAIAGTRSGSITIRSPRRVRLNKVRCPLEPVELLALGPVPGPLSVSPSTLSSPRNTRITLTASRARRTRFADPEAGTLKERSVWTLMLTRIP